MALDNKTSKQVSIILKEDSTSTPFKQNTRFNGRFTVYNEHLWTLWLLNVSGTCPQSSCSKVKGNMAQKSSSCPGFEHKWYMVGYFASNPTTFTHF